MQVENACLEVHRDRAAQPAEHVEDLADIRDVGDAVKPHRFARQQRRAQDGQDGVLVGGRNDAALKGLAAVDDEM